MKITFTAASVVRLSAIAGLCFALPLSLCVPALAASPTRVVCQSSDSDPDGDGFGWENGASCRMSALPSVKPACVSTNDPDGDGFGWENGKSCRIVKRAAKPVCQLPGSDPDGDGFGWENGGSCRVAVVNTKPVCTGANADPDGDGFGWENGRSCRVAALLAEERVFIRYPACSAVKYDADRDGYGWENSVSCFSGNTGDGGKSITDLVLITGQSNALGAETGLLDAKPYDPILDSPVKRVYVYANTGWTIADLRQIWDLNWYPRGDIATAPANNFGMHFGKTLVRKSADRVVGFIVITAPGEDIAHWDKDGRFFERIDTKVRRALKALPHINSIDAILWHQGESNYADSSYYTRKLNELTANFRTRSWFTANGLFICGETLNSPVNRRLRALNTDGDSRTGCVTANGLDSLGDDVHFSAASLRTLGFRYANKYLEMMRR